MGKDNIIQSLLSGKVSMTPNGFAAEQLSSKQFADMHELFFDAILNIHAADIAEIDGYGEFDETCKPAYGTCREFLIGTFTEPEEGYWYRWKEMFDTTLLERSFFEAYFQEMQARIPFCEGRRYLVNNNTFFMNLITDGRTTIGIPDWSRSGIADFLLDFVIMDLHKPFWHIPERLAAYTRARNIVIPDFKERYLCMAYYKGLDVLRWHASIDDEQSCLTIMKTIREWKARIDAL